MPKDYFDWNMSSSNASSAANSDEQERGREKNVLEFIHQILRKSPPDEEEPESYINFLRDGVIIEELMIRACPTPLGKKASGKLSKHPTPTDRVEKIINDMFEYGVSVENLFDPDDLLKAADIPKVGTRP